MNISNGSDYPTASPLPVGEVVSAESVKIDFFEAMKCIAEGKRVTKQEWDNENIYCVMHNGLIMIHKETGYHGWLISDGDMSGNDWYVLGGE